MVTLVEHATTAPVEPAKNGYHHKLRQFGAMLDIHRRHRGQEQILVVSDISKAEISAGTSRRFTEAGQERWAVFAGGRDDAAELPVTTLERELTEEFDEAAERRGLTLPAEVQAAVQSTLQLPEQYGYLFPFIVGQLKHEPGKPLKINEIAASTVSIEFDQFAPELQRAFGYLQQKRLATWIGLDKLTQAFQYARVLHDPKVDQMPVRPQLLTMAMIHAMQQVNGYSDEAVANVVLSWNSSIASQLHRLAKKHQVVVNNGVFTQRGTIYKNLPEEDRAYLGLSN